MFRISVSIPLARRCAWRRFGSRVQGKRIRLALSGRRPHLGSSVGFCFLYRSKKAGVRRLNLKPTAKPARHGRAWRSSAHASVATPRAFSKQKADDGSRHRQDAARKESAMGRCSRSSNLEVHHKRRDGGNGPDNAQVLCQPCHQGTSTYGAPGKSPPDFPEWVKAVALGRAGHRCECTTTRGCH